MAHGAAAARHDREEADELIAFVMRGILELGVGEERVENAEVGVAEGLGGEGQVEEVGDDDVDEHAEVIGVEVFVR